MKKFNVNLIVIISCLNLINCEKEKKVNDKLNSLQNKDLTEQFKKESLRIQKRLEENSKRRAWIANNLGDKVLRGIYKREKRDIKKWIKGNKS